MKDEVLSSGAATVTDARAAAVFADSRLRRLLMMFAAEPLTLSQAAARSGADLKRLHHHVQKLLRRGLLDVVEERPRAGRPLKLYRTTHPSFFIPAELVSAPWGEGLARELRERLASDSRRCTRGLLFTLGSEGQPYARVVRDADARPQAVEMWRVLRLDTAQAEALRAELDAVLDRYQATAGGRGGVYLVHAALARRHSEDGPLDNRNRDPATSEAGSSPPSSNSPPPRVPAPSPGARRG